MSEKNTCEECSEFELLVLVLYKTEVYTKLMFALNDAGITGATTVSATGMAHTLADAEDSHIIAAFRAFVASSSGTESKMIFMVINKELRNRAREVINKVVGDLAEPGTGILFSVPIGFADGLYQTAQS